MEPGLDPFYFDKTDLFNKIKRLETVLGVGSFNVQEVLNRLDSIEQTLNVVNTSYTTKTYVDNKLIQKINKTGDSVLGNLALLTEPLENNHLVTKEYVVNLISQINQFDASLLATKVYVDQAIASVNQQVGNIDTNLTTTQQLIVTETANKISKFGDILYGELILANDATQPLHPITKQQFDATLSTLAVTGTLDW